jgi:hypothetical protein
MKLRQPFDFTSPDIVETELMVRYLPLLKLLGRALI